MGDSGSQPLQARAWLRYPQIWAAAALSAGVPGSPYVANSYFPYAAKKRRLMVAGQWVTMVLGQWVHDFWVSREFQLFLHGDKGNMVKHTCLVSTKQ
jgi:hypothetical protein